jgi:predicted Holliday junction resolvase-like endonuclease
VILAFLLILIGIMLARQMIKGFKSAVESQNKEIENTLKGGF